MGSTDYRSPDGASSPAPLVRLSVIVPVRTSAFEIPLPETLSRKAQAERTVQSILAQDDPVGVEVLVACGGPSAAVADHLEGIFAQAIATHRLKVLRFPNVQDPAILKNEAASLGRGHFLAFVENGDWWRPARLRRLDPWFAGSDLILSAQDDFRRSTDWLRSFLSENWAQQSSLVVRRALFDRVGGFPVGCSGTLLPKRLPGSDIYEFTLKALMELVESHAQDRFTVIGGEEIVVEGRKLPGALAGIDVRARKIREKASLLHLMRNLPARHRPLALRALMGRKKISG